MKTDSPEDREPDPEREAAAGRIEKELEESLERIDTPQEAEEVVERIARDTAGQTAGEAGDRADQGGKETAESAARNVEAAARQGGDDAERAAAVIEATAAEAAALEEDDVAAAESIERAIQERFWYEDPEGFERPRRLLLDAFLRHRSISYLQRLDAELFLLANVHFPHTAELNRFFRFVALAFRNGYAWMVGTALFLPVWPRQVWRILRWIVPAIIFASVMVEQVLKWYFQRRRPYLRIVRSVIIGSKPSSWSFPSGHSAAAFAGAHALGKFLPALRPLWFAIAGVVGFCRAYLGAHYPSDIAVGGIFGMLFTEVAFWLLARLGLKR